MSIFDDTGVGVAASLSTPPNKPTNTTPASSATGVDTTPDLVSSDYAGGTGTHAHTQYQVSTVSDFATTVYDSGELGAVTTDTVTTTLSNSTVYYWRVRYQNSLGQWSSWSTATSFTTEAALPSQLIGSLTTTTALPGVSPNYLICSQFTAAASGNVVTIKVRATKSGNVKVGIYADTGSDLPGTLLASTGSTAVTSGENSITITSTAITSGNKYWLAYNQEATDVIAATSSGGYVGFTALTFSNALPNPSGIASAGTTWLVGIAGWG